MFYISYFINAQSYYHNIKPKTFYIRGLGASPFFFSHHAPPPLVEVMSKSQTSKGCVLGVENRENKNSWLMTTWPLLLQIRLTSNNLPESFFPIFVSGIHWFWDFSLKLVFQSSFYFLINSILADLQDVSPVVTTSAIIGYGMQHCRAIVMRTPVTNKSNDDSSQGVRVHSVQYQWKNQPGAVKENSKRNETGILRGYPGTRRFSRVPGKGTLMCQLRPWALVRRPRESNTRPTALQPGALPTELILLGSGTTPLPFDWQVSVLSVRPQLFKRWTALSSG